MTPTTPRFGAQLHWHLFIMHSTCHALPSSHDNHFNVAAGCLPLKPFFSSTRTMFISIIISIHTIIIFLGWFRYLGGTKQLVWFTFFISTLKFEIIMFFLCYWIYINIWAKFDQTMVLGKFHPQPLPSPYSVWGRFYWPSLSLMFATSRNHDFQHLIRKWRDLRIQMWRYWRPSLAKTSLVQSTSLY